MISPVGKAERNHRSPTDAPSSTWTSNQRIATATQRQMQKNSPSRNPTRAKLRRSARRAGDQHIRYRQISSITASSTSHRDRRRRLTSSSSQRVVLRRSSDESGFQQQREQPRDDLLAPSTTGSASQLPTTKPLGPLRSSRSGGARAATRRRDADTSPARAATVFVGNSQRCSLAHARRRDACELVGNGRRWNASDFVLIRRDPVFGVSPSVHPRLDSATLICRQTTIDHRAEQLPASRRRSTGHAINPQIFGGFGIATGSRLTQKSLDGSTGRIGFHRPASASANAMRRRQHHPQRHAQRPSRRKNVRN